MNWDSRLKEQVARRFDNYTRMRIDLSVARTNQLFTQAGEFLYIEAASSSGAIATVRLNRDKNPELDISLHSKIETVFTCYYLTNAAQAGQWIDVLVGVDFKKEDEGFSAALPAYRFVCTLAATAYQMTPVPICRVLIRAAVANTGYVRVNFKSPPAGVSYFELFAGESISVNLSNLNQVYLLAQNAGSVVYMVYEQ